jgi:hypothetical protein
MKPGTDHHYGAEIGLAQDQQKRQRQGAADQKMLARSIASLR